MAQQRLRDYQSPLGSFLHNLINLGVHRPGRFCGFDTLVQTGQFQFSLTHQASGTNTSDAAGNPYGPLGVLMTNQGEVIIEDAQLDGLSIAPNNANPFNRIDQVVINHQYLQLANPAAATYSVVRGPNGQSIPTALTRFQTLIGTLTVPPNALINQCTYIKAICPDSGDSPDAKLNVPNDFTAINQNAQEPNEINTPAFVNGQGINFWDMTTNGNSFIVNPTAIVTIDGLRIVNGSNKDGTEITLIINQFTRIRNNVVIPPSTDGYAPILFSSRLTAAKEVFLGVNTNVLTPPSGAATSWVITLIKVRGKWIIKAVDGVNFNASTWLKGMTMEVTMAMSDVLTFFDETGLGVADWTGWAIKNSLNGTGLDRRGRMPVGAIDIPALGAPNVVADLIPIVGNLNLGSGFGKTSHTLVTPELPNTSFSVPGITGGDNSDNNNLTHFAGGDKPNGQGTAFNIAVGSGGQDEAFSIMPPYDATFWVVRIV